MRNKALFIAAAAVVLSGTSAANACEICFNPHLPQPPGGGFGGGSSTTSGLVTPAYSSRPSAAATLFLDLDGIVYDGTWAGKTPGTVPAYDTDGDPTTFSANELASIREIYIRVAEAFSPFNINVTTVDPGDFTQARLNTRVIIGGDNSWYGGAGGVAYVGGFTWDDGDFTGRTAWAFPQNLGGGYAKYVADATIHEAGHQFGLAHQSAFDDEGNLTDPYRRSLDGGLTAPNMGVAYAAVRGLWSDGPRNSSSGPQQQLDLDILTSTWDNRVNYPYSSYYNGFGLREDDWGDSLSEAADLVPDASGLTAAGVIELSTDTDVFRFTATGGFVDIEVDGAEFGQMLDIVLNLYDVWGDLLHTDNPALTLSPEENYGLDASFSGELAAGHYFLEVGSNGGYGDIGQFFVTVTGAVLVPEPGAFSLAALVAVGLGLRRRRA